MGLKADIEEVVSGWSKAPWWVRAWLVLSGFLAISSVASLAETVSKWKGFIGDAIYFYRHWISGPIKDALSSFFSIHIHPISADGSVIGMILIGSMIRLHWLTTDWTSKKERIHFFFTSIFLIAAPFIAIYRANNRSTPPNLTLIAVSVIIFLAIPAIFRLKRAIIFYLQILMVLAVIAILAAINAGLSK